MKQTNDQRVAEILARGVARVQALGIADAASASDDRTQPQDDVKQTDTEVEVNPPTKSEVSQ